MFNYRQYKKFLEVGRWKTTYYVHLEDVCEPFDWQLFTDVTSPSQAPVAVLGSCPEFYQLFSVYLHVHTGLCSCSHT